MAYLIAIAVALVLAAGFLALTVLESARGGRVLAGPRARLDRGVEHLEFIVTHVDLGSFAQEESKKLAARAGHDIARAVLRAVRAVERVLTRLVRKLRPVHEMPATPREASRDYVKTLSDFKGHLESTRPEVPSVHDVE